MPDHFDLANLAILIVAEVLRDRMRRSKRTVWSLDAIWREAEREFFHMTQCHECARWGI